MEERLSLVLNRTRDFVVAGRMQHRSKGVEIQIEKYRKTYFKEKVREKMDDGIQFKKKTNFKQKRKGNMLTKERNRKSWGTYTRSGNNQVMKILIFLPFQVFSKKKKSCSYQHSVDRVIVPHAHDWLKLRSSKTLLPLHQDDGLLAVFTAPNTSCRGREKSLVSRIEFYFVPSNKVKESAFVSFLIQ